MNRFIGYLKRHSKGQMTFLMAGIIAGLLGAVAMCTDVAVMYANSIRLQTGVDAAAIAGANYLTTLAFPGTDASCTGQSDDAKKAACSYAVRNGMTAADLTLTEPTSTTIKVAATRTALPYYFGRAVGLTTYDLAASSTAQASLSIGQVNDGMFPVGLQCTATCTLANMDPGQSVTFGQKFVGGLAPGNWQWLSIGGNGSSALGAAIQNGAPGVYKIGDTLQSMPGNKGNSNPATNGLNARLAACYAQSNGDPCTSGSGNSLHNISAGDPCLVVVPAVDYHGCNGNCTMTIEGFALIYLEQTSTSTSIQGCFVQAVKSNTITLTGAPNLGGNMPAILIN